MFDFLNLEKKCFKIIEENSIDIVESPEFLTISKNSLQK